MSRKEEMNLPCAVFGVMPGEISRTERVPSDKNV